jgi:hypothetical protein
MKGYRLGNSKPGIAQQFKPALHKVGIGVLRTLCRVKAGDEISPQNTTYFPTIQLQPMARLCACTFLLFKKDTPTGFVLKSISSSFSSSVHYSYSLSWYLYKLVLGLKLG